MPTPTIRPAVESDLPELVRIYNHYVVRTHVTFDTEPFTPETRRPWFGQFAASGPHRLFVAEVEDGLAGYASSQQFRKKPGYRSSVETTIYLDRERTGRGLGRRLYTVLLDALIQEPGVHRGYGGIALPNPASIALHEKLGYTLVGTFRAVGVKLERWVDVSWYEKDLSGG